MDRIEWTIKITKEELFKALRLYLFQLHSEDIENYRLASMPGVNKNREDMEYFSGRLTMNRKVQDWLEKAEWDGEFEIRKSRLVKKGRMGRKILNSLIRRR